MNTISGHTLPVSEEDSKTISDVDKKNSKFRMCPAACSVKRTQRFLTQLEAHFTTVLPEYQDQLCF